MYSVYIYVYKVGPKKWGQFEDPHFLLTSTSSNATTNFCYFWHTSIYLPPWLSGLTLSELQCSEPGWLVRWRGFASSCCKHVESGFCMLRLNSRAVQRVRLYPLSNATSHHTRVGGVWVWWEPLVQIQMARANGLTGRPHVGTLPETPAG